MKYNGSSQAVAGGGDPIWRCGQVQVQCCHQAWDPSPVATSLSCNGSVTLDKCAPNHPPESHRMNIYYLSIKTGWQFIYHRPDL